MAIDPLVDSGENPYWQVAVGDGTDSRILILKHGLVISVRSALRHNFRCLMQDLFYTSCLLVCGNPSAS